MVEVKVTPGLHEAEAADVCPAEFLEPCTEMYVATVESGFPGVVCIFPAGQWSIGTPGENGNGRRVGEACGTDGTGVVEKSNEFGVYEGRVGDDPELEDRDHCTPIDDAAFLEAWRRPYAERSLRRRFLGWLNGGRDGEEPQTPR